MMWTQRSRRYLLVPQQRPTTTTTTTVLAAPLLLLLGVLVLLLPIGTTDGYPTGAGSCLGGQAAVGGSHLNSTIRPIIRGASLTEGGFVVSIGDVDLLALAHGGGDSPPPVFDLNTDYEIAVRATEFAYKGCLIRLQPLNGQDTTAVLTPGIDTGPAEVCETPIVGITHTDATFKQRNSGILNMAQAGQVKLDVTIVGLNNATASLYAYDGFRVQFGEVAQASEPVEPQQAPTVQLVTRAPTPAPVAAPVVTEAPVASAPVTSAPVTVTSAPVVTVTSAPVTSAPATTAPVTSAPVAKAPVTSAPATTTPATSAPATSSPVTSAPSDSPSAAPVTTTSAPVPQMTDTEQPSRVTTDGDSEAPVSVPAPVVPPSPPANTPVQQSVQNMQITFTGISDDMSSFEQQEWEMLTEDWFDDFYNNNNNGRRLQSDTPGVGDNYGVVAGSMTNTVQVTQTAFDDSSNGGTLVVVYNHEYAYEAKESAFGPLQYATLPFRSTQARDAYSAQLQLSIEPFAAMDTPVQVPKIGGPGIAADSDDDGLSGGAIAGICCGGLVVVGTLAFGGYSRKTAVEKRNAAAIHSSQEIGREAFTFDAGFDELSPKGSNLLAASSQGLPAIGTQSTLSYDPERLYTVFAPKGTLGIVLDNPDQNGPVVYIIKDNSPLLNKMTIGDRMIAVDEVDVRAMSPTKISKLISKRSTNPVRKLTLVKAPPEPEEEERDPEEDKNDVKGEKDSEDDKNDRDVEEEKEAESDNLSSPICVDDASVGSGSPIGEVPTIAIPEETPEVHTIGAVYR